MELMLVTRGLLLRLAPTGTIEDTVFTWQPIQEAEEGRAKEEGNCDRAGKFNELARDQLEKKLVLMSSL